MVTNPKVLEELKRLERNWGIPVEEMVAKYTIKDTEMVNRIYELGQKFDNRIPERFINELGLNPREIQITTDGEISVVCRTED